MKHFTKIFIALAFVFTGATSQAQFDVGANIVSAISNQDTLWDNLPAVFVFDIVNDGQDIPAFAGGTTDTMFFDLLVDGVVRETFIWPNQAVFASGAVQTLFSPDVDVTTWNLTGPTDPTICLVSRYAPDMNTANDTTDTCRTAHYPGVDVVFDMGITAVSIVAPAPNAGQIEACQEITEFNVTVQNFGTRTIPAGVTTPKAYSIPPGAAIPSAAVLQADLAPGATVVQTITNPAVTPTLPTVPGNYELCGTTTFGGDPDASNDETCLPFEIVVPTVTITSLDPPAHVVNTEVVITGTGFSDVDSENTVRFFGTIAGVTNSSETQLTAIVPVGAQSGVVTIDVDNCGNIGMAGSPSDFTVLESDPQNPLWPLSIEENSLEIENIYVLENNLNVTIINTTKADVANLTITNLAGQQVHTEQITVKGQSTINGVVNLSGIAQGFYNLTINTDGATNQAKFYVQ